MNFIKLLPVSPVGPLHTPVQFRKAWRELKENDIFSSTALLKLILELRTPIDLDGFNLKRKFLDVGEAGDRRLEMSPRRNPSLRTVSGARS
jgi:hypothetical protein